MKDSFINPLSGYVEDKVLTPTAKGSMKSLFSGDSAAGTKAELTTEYWLSRGPRVTQQRLSYESQHPPPRLL